MENAELNTKKQGKAGEAQAAQWLADHGYTVCARNFHCKYGEIDLIAYRENTISFIEVKYRKNAGSGFAQEAVPAAKQRKICRTADYFRMRFGLTERYSYRFDVIAINGNRLAFYENAFDYIGSA